MNKQKTIQHIALLLLSISYLLFVRCSDESMGEEQTVFSGQQEAPDTNSLIEEKIYDAKSIDGPYLINGTVITVDLNEQIRKEALDRDTVTVWINAAEERFNVPLKTEFSVEPALYDMPERLIAISDIEGNFTAFSSFLQANQVLNERFQWTFGRGHLVLVGDFVDRGEDVLQTLWLIYKLEEEAKQSGGQVHFLLGNHEIMNIQGDFRYVQDKYKKLAIAIGNKNQKEENYTILFSTDSHLGLWLRSKNIVERIGDYLFTHAGLSPNILPLDISIDEINQIIRANIDRGLYKNPNGDEKASFLMGVESPFWYRGLITDYTYYDKIKEQELDAILTRYKAKTTVVGHSIVEDISYDFQKKVLRMDVKHGRKKGSTQTKGVLIERGQVYKVDAAGGKERL
ncbi:MAG: metallophosphoesterase [Bacteroidota bacterium]